MKTAFITGIAGQDGSYLSEHLLSLGYRVTGIVRRNSTVEHQRNRLFHLPSLELEYGDLTDQSSLERALRLFKPDEIYNLGAQSHVRISTDIPQFTAQVNALGVLNLLESYRHICPEARFYQASSSEMFGSAVDSDGFQRETSKMTPVSPYGCSKVFAYNVVHNYRIGHKLFASNGILFNHESPRRGSNFVTNKVVKGAVEIKLGLATTLEMGNMDSFRDWGHSKDYVKAMHLILQHDKADDFVVATGETRSVREMCNYVFSQLGLNYADHVVQNPKYLRPEELKYLRGDSTKIRTTLDWKPEYTFNMLMDEMIEFWMKIYQDQSHTV
ncbi:Gmd GDP-D-mannose dehydratase [uncultured Caudovirales phage]|uniref:GDP-mannose 4,6-dehydratase n=1 Tax=uncultured Caudovirales phage TaxID=2100421 RepID=A0A6J5P9N6_9CAUD|nr:Gmd GDP-D-mannose dehydratase [uncultured Caudovirales phage]CAB4165815.1 Gmd GDP-D-mannose dehydratase [uncultured Caudovirales phage]CAB4186955.1 Gmd GDP-D-mannose dehydratase [uncultured Caudovirales phage]CAB4221326.1 Gmd GDP-D-mannose dehydratase [uncultured Caudovirales phage]